MKIQQCLFFILVLLFATPIWAGDQVSVAVVEQVNEINEEVDEGAVGYIDGEYASWKMANSLMVGSYYDSNIFYDHANEENDFVTVIAPTFYLYKQGGQLKVGIRYTPSYTMFTNNTEQSKLNHALSVQGVFKSEQWSLQLLNTFSYSHFPATTEQTGRISTISNTFFSEAKYQLSEKMAFALVYQNQLLFYQDDAFEQSNYYENAFGPRWYYQISPNVEVYVSAEANNTIMPDGDNDGQGYSAYVGLKGQLTRKTALVLETGMRDQSFDEAEDFQGHWMQGVVKYKASSKTELGLRLKRDIQMSTYQDVGYYESILMSPSITFDMSSKIRLEYHFDYVANRYPIETIEDGKNYKRKDDTYRHAFSLKYALKKDMSLMLGYDLENKDSNINKYSYDKAVYRLNFNIKF